MRPHVVLAFYTYSILRVNALKSSGLEQVHTESVLVEPRIFGGQDAEKGRYLYAQISLRDWSGNHQCGGSLIASDVVLTAGHCRGHFANVHIGRYNRSDPFEEFAALSPIEERVHPMYDSGEYRYDFALVKLESAIGGAPPLVKINANQNLLSEGDSLVVVGYGANATRNDTLQFPDIFQVGDVNYLSNPSCRDTEINDKREYEDRIFSEMLCASSNTGVDACAGDSGSALVRQGETKDEDVQVGVVSWGTGCAIYPGVYGRISKVYDWIRMNTCELASDPPAYFLCDGNDHSPTTAPEPDGRFQNQPKPEAETATEPSPPESGICYGFSSILNMALLAFLYVLCY